MADSRSRPTRPTSSGARRKSVGGPERGNTFPVVFIGAVVAVVLAFVVLITVAADAFSGDDPPVSPGTPPLETATTGSDSSPAPADPTATTAPPTAAATPTSTPDSTGAIPVACGDILAPLDKQHRLAGNCVPPDLQALPAEYASGTQRMRAEARTAILELFAEAKLAGFALYVNSSYRSYDEQAATFQFWVNQNGLEYAQRTSARAGHSEHQLGTTADVGWNGCELECTQGTPEAAWLAANAPRFGFIVSYPQGKEAITGYAYEPWHIRYVGKDTAQQVVASGLTLHEYLLK